MADAEYPAAQLAQAAADGDVESVHADAAHRFGVVPVRHQDGADRIGFHARVGGIEFRPAAGAPGPDRTAGGFGEPPRSEEHTSELQSPMRNSYDVFCLKQNIYNNN